MVACGAGKQASDDGGGQPYLALLTTFVLFR
jgi:hypothetical protein